VDAAREKLTIASATARGRVVTAAWAIKILFSQIGKAFLRVCSSARIEGRKSMVWSKGELIGLAPRYAKVRQGKEVRGENL
jgi:hypothetical protein